MEKSPYEEAFEYLTSRVSLRPKIGVICGSGLGGFGDIITEAKIIPYNEIPHFPVSTVKGHKGCLVFGYVDGKAVICMQGRFHLYEGNGAHACAFPIRVMKLFGVEKLVLTNAAGGLNKSYKLGDFMMLKDHCNIPALCGLSPLVGINDPKWGPRFVCMQNAYDNELRESALQVAEEIGETRLQEGVYFCQVGPCYETVSEMKFAQACGADALGMSTVYEVVAARHCGIKCFAVSLITNECNATYDKIIKVSHEEVIETATARGADMVKFISAVIQKW